MGNKLPMQAAFDSHKAIKEYQKVYGSNSKRSVWVSKKGKEILAVSDVTVVVSPGTYGSDLYEVNIVWDDAGLRDHRAIDLYVVYSSMYCPMEFVKERLIIHGNDGMVVEIG